MGLVCSSLSADHAGSDAGLRRFSGFQAGIRSYYMAAAMKGGTPP
ncbi:hypothetical protein CVCC1112_1862 [Paenarthrobacter nicotinovorans]|nr:hypothetical protein CVCC1112_1862 [Paenarthrobacter nicotinovorans]